MGKKLIDSVHGIGKIYRGDSILMEAPYSVKIYRQYQGDVPGLREILGSIEADPLQIIPLIGQELTLEFADGARIGFFFRSGNGEIANTTGIEGPVTAKTA